MLINYIIIFLSGFFSILLFTALLRKFSLRRNLLISFGVSLIGGIALGLSLFLIALIFYFIKTWQSREIWGIITASMVMLIFGAIDDWHELSIKAKFLVQIIASALLVTFGIKTHIVYIGNLANIIITFLWIVGVTNAFNHLDVMDGLAASTAAIISLAFFIIAFLTGNIDIATLSLILAASCAGFLVFNLPPAKIYMGNSGSHFLGFLLAAIAISISYAPLERKIALLSPIFILGLPLFDTAFLILARLKNNTSPFKKSNDHLALKLLSIGYSKNKTLLMLVILCAFFSFCGILLSKIPNIAAVVIVVFVFLISWVVMLRMKRVYANG